MKNFIFLFIILICSCSREKDLEIEFPYKSKIVVYGYLGNENGSSLNLYNSAPVETTNPQYKNLSAQAYLYENGSLVDTFIRGIDDVLFSDYKINNEGLYNVHVIDKDVDLSCKDVFLPISNVIKDYDIKIESSSNDALLSISFLEPLKYGDDILAFTHNGTKVSLQYSYDITDDRKKIILNFKYKYPVFGPSKEIVRIDTLSNLDIIFKYYSYEKGQFDIYRGEISSQIGNNSSKYTPPWTNIEGAYGFVTSYICDSIRIEF